MAVARSRGKSRRKARTPRAPAIRPAEGLVWTGVAGTAAGALAPAIRPAEVLVWGGYLAAIVAAEVLVALWSPQLGIALYVGLLFALPVHAVFAAERQRPLLLSLVFAPLVRIVSLALPLASVPVTYWHLLTSLPLFVGAAMAIRVLGLSRHQLGLRLGNVPVQLAIALLGVPLGVTEYLILRPAPIIADLTWPMLPLAALNVLVSTGLLEELIFRGLLQATALQALGRPGLVYVSAVFAALHIGYVSALDVVFVFAVGLGFARLVARTRSLLGVTLAHGLTNTGLLLVLPLLLGGPS